MFREIMWISGALDNIDDFTFRIVWISFIDFLGTHFPGWCTGTLSRIWWLLAGYWLATYISFINLFFELKYIYSFHLKPIANFRSFHMLFLRLHPSPSPYTHGFCMQVITLCNCTKDELLQEVEQFNQQRLGSQEENSSAESAVFQYLNHVQTYPTITLGGVDGSRITTVALVRLWLVHCFFLFSLLELMNWPVPVFYPHFWSSLISFGFPPLSWQIVTCQLRWWICHVDLLPFD